MHSLNIHSPAKINLFLNVVGKRPDGYHELESIFQTVSLFDIIELNEKKAGISVKTDHPGLPTGRNNLAYKAAELIRNNYGIKQGVDIFICKNIPIGGGLGGGSSNAATVLTGLNRLWKLGISRSELSLLAAEIGSDVPFFIYGGTALVKGRGEIVFPLEIKNPFHYLLVSPHIAVPTKEIYQNLRLYLTRPKNNGSEIIHCLTTGDSDQISRLLYNSLEAVALGLYPELKAIYLRLQRKLKGKLLVSGSGSTIFRICNSSKEVRRLAGQIRADQTLTKQCRVFTVSSAD